LRFSGIENDKRFFQEISVMWFDFFFSFSFSFSLFRFLIFIRACSFHPNVIKLIGYTTEPKKYIITKLYDLDLFQFIHHPTEDLSSLLALKLTR